jgi:hypothetical protein
MDKPTNDKILKRLLGPADGELLCDECFEKLDQYVELEFGGREADARIPGMRAHLEGCPPATRTTRACATSCKAASRTTRTSRSLHHGARAAVGCRALYGSQYELVS